MANKILDIITGYGDGYKGTMLIQGTFDVGLKHHAIAERHPIELIVWQFSKDDLQTLRDEIDQMLIKGDYQ